MQQNTKSARRTDRVAKWVITVGGVMVIAAIVGIFVEIFGVTLPLFRGANVTIEARFPADDNRTVVAVATDDYIETSYLVYETGYLQLHQLRPQKKLQRKTLFSAHNTQATITYAEHVGEHLALTWSDGSASWFGSRFYTRFDDANNRQILHQLRELTSSTYFAAATAPDVHRIRYADDVMTEIAVFDQTIQIHRSERSENFLGDVETSRSSHTLELPTRPIAVLPVVTGGELTVVQQSGAVQRYAVRTDELSLIADAPAANPGNTQLRTANLLLGDFSVILGTGTGNISVWFPVRDQDDPGNRHFRKIHTLPKQRHAIKAIQAFPNNKSFLTVDDVGEIQVNHATSARNLLRFGNAPIEQVALNQRGSAIISLNSQGIVTVRSIENPHPEVSFATLFGKVWYEGYDEPVYSWQSSSASTDFEPKLSLIPLISGTFKATFYALLFSVPLALLAAIYASQFLSRKIHGVVKPVIELMAAFPSVVVGFLAALWLAPVLETNMVSLSLCWITIPSTIALWLGIWRRVERKNPELTKKRGIEYIALLPILTLAVALAVWLSSPVENILFDGNFNRWLFAEIGMQYDQRNAIVIAFALGFAVVPIIFTIADDALSNVPKGLSAASLAVGASRWQTVWKVVLPSASPGIFAAVMIGLGRAIGETMIVLMAAGNTPIMDWSPYNGMRTLSANIAVEIPEAPFGGTLYRVLFLSALLLFMFTFFANTVAEIVRTRLREKYGRF